VDILLAVAAGDARDILRRRQIRQHQRREEHVGRHQHKGPEAAEHGQTLHHRDRRDRDQAQTHRVGHDAERARHHHHAERDFSRLPAIFHVVEDFAISLDELHAVTERARDVEQRHHHDQRLNRQIEPTDEAEAPDGRNRAGNHRHHDANHVPHIDDEAQDQRRNRHGKNREHLMLVVINPTCQGRLTRHEHLMVRVAVLLDEALHIIEGLAVIEQSLDERHANQRGGFIRRNQKCAGVGRHLDTSDEFIDIGLRGRGVVTHDRLTVDTSRDGFSVARLFGGDREHLVMIDARREVRVAGQVPDLVQGLEIVDRAILVAHHQRDGQRITEIGVIPERFDVGVICRKQIGEDRAQFDVARAPGKKQCDGAHQDDEGETEA